MNTGLLLLWAGIYVLHVLLKIRLILTCLLGIFLTGMLMLHQKRRKKAEVEGQRFREAALYMDTVLYSFLKEQKILPALQNTERVMSGCRISRTLKKAISYMQMTFDESEVMSTALGMIEQEYPCSRIRGIHAFMIHAEHYGGEIEVPVQLLLTDKNYWEKRINSSMKERQDMFRQILLSVMASVLICSMILYLPVMNIDISSSMITQILTAAVLVMDDLIIYRGQKYIMADWLQLGTAANPEAEARAMEEWRKYDVKKEIRLSITLALVPAAASAVLLWTGHEIYFSAALGMTILFLNQHRIGRALKKRRLVQLIRSAFPAWLLDLVLLLQSENVQMALQKSEADAPAVLKQEVKLLAAKLELAPEQAYPYQEFLQEFAIPEVYSAMGMLYSLSIGSTGSASRQIRELTEKNMQMMDQADTIRLKDRTSGMYLLFLAPVLTASLKLAGDMTVFLLSFVKTTVVM